MGKTVIRILTMGAGLIAIYLFVANSTATVNIIKGLGGTANDISKTLQGR